jgi:RNA polymerase sigma-70 factor (ECF subfamily)
MAIDGERIAAIYIVRNPDKLRHVPDRINQPTG